MLNNEQQRAVTHLYGPALVSAGPGSGKTRVLTERIRKLLGHVPAGKICVFTFTNAAAREMKERFARLTDRETSEKVMFGTFHAIFLRWLVRWGVVGPDITVIDSKEETDIKEDSRDGDIPAFHMGQGDEETHPAGEMITFDGIIDRTYDAVMDQGFRMDHQFFLIDEFQDIDRRQYEIIKALTGPEGNLFVVGDEDQSIYGFRGASPDIMLEFMKDHPTAVHLYLSVNYRCSRTVTEVSQRLIRHNTMRFDKEIVARSREDRPVELQEARDTMEEVRSVAWRIRRIRFRERIPYDRIAVLARTGAEGDLAYLALREAGIPCRRTIHRELFLHRDFVLIEEDVRRISRASHQMDDPGQLRYLCRIFPLIIDAGRDQLSPEERIEIEQDLRTIGRVRSSSAFLSVLDLLWNSRYDRYLKDKLAKTGMPASCIFFQLVRLIGRRKKGVHVGTMHGAKGLEFDAVFVVGLNEENIPRKEADTLPGIEEERRLLYVAMTRAVKFLHLSLSREKEPSRFIAEMRGKGLVDSNG